jgi:hypothetical protein
VPLETRREQQISAQDPFQLRVRIHRTIDALFVVAEAVHETRAPTIPVGFQSLDLRVHRPEKPLPRGIRAIDVRLYSLAFTLKAAGLVVTAQARKIREVANLYDHVWFVMDNSLRDMIEV